jgi:3-hydroxyisobutyrate dehydrogenase-like beta-hydroxyacid dehydrogenase
VRCKHRIVRDPAVEPAQINWQVRRRRVGDGMEDFGMKRRIAVIGTGRMGSALAAVFVGQGHTVSVWNRTASKAKALETKGVRVAASVEDAIAAAEIVIGNVSDYPTNASLLTPPAVTQALREKVFVQLATGTPRQAREAASWALEHQIRYLDGAIMAGPNFIGQSGCTILYAGEKELFESQRSLFAALGGHPLYVGPDVGHANTLAAALLIVLWGSLFGTWHAAAICEAEAFPLDAFASSLSATMPVIEGVLKDSVRRIAERRFAADAATTSSLAPCRASAMRIHEISQEHGIHLGLTEALETIFKRGSDAGRGADDLASGYQGMRPARVTSRRRAGA